jgi:hypothetical protein
MRMAKLYIVMISVESPRLLVNLMLCLNWT